MLFALQSLIQDRYRLIQQLGFNGSRQTWLAKDEQTEMLVTLKALSFELETEWQDLKLSEREAATLQSLKHPRIPQFIDSFWLDQQENHQFFLVYSYIEGQSLGSLADAGKRWSLPEVKDLAQAILEILDYLHCLAPPVIHRDIKPSNVVFGKDNQVYLIDFGAVQGQMGNGKTMTIVGTYGYMPPEQFYGQTTPASDLYSLGATLLTLMTGADPSKWPREGTRILLQTWPQLDIDFRNWLEHLLEPEISRRFSTSKEAINALRNAAILRKQKTHSLDTKQVLDEAPKENRLAPILLSQSTIEEITAPVGSRIEMYKDQNALQIVVPPAIFRSLKGILVTGIFPVGLAAFILFLTQLPNASILGGMIFIFFPVATIILFLAIAAVISIIFNGGRFTINKTRFLLEYSGLFGDWNGIISDDFQTLAKLEYTKDMSSYTLWIVLSNGSREKLADRLTLAECQWIVEVFEDWVQSRRWLV
jgi:serine/threonine protein kinase